MRRSDEREDRAVLVRILQDAHAGELAAAYAYRAHWHSLWRTGRELQRAEVRRIEGAEWHHRALVAGMLRNLGARPRRPRELQMAAIGRFFGLLCFVTGWFGPMYAAGRLEAMNVLQYADARNAAERLGLTPFLEPLAEMIAEEERHEQWFGDRVRGHWLLPVTSRVLGWTPPPPVLSSGTWQQVPRPDDKAV